MQTLQLWEMQMVINIKFMLQLSDTSSYKIDKAYTQKAINPNTGASIPIHPQNNKSGVLGVTYGDDSTVNSVGTGIEKKYYR